MIRQLKALVKDGSHFTCVWQAAAFESTCISVCTYLQAKYASKNAVSTDVPMQAAELEQQEQQRASEEQVSTGEARASPDSHACLVFAMLMFPTVNEALSPPTSRCSEASKRKSAVHNIVSSVHQCLQSNASCCACRKLLEWMLRQPSSMQAMRRSTGSSRH